MTIKPSELPNQIIGKEVHPVLGSALQATGEGSSPHVVRGFSSIDHFVCSADGYVLIEYVLNARAVSNLTVQRQYRDAIRLRDTRVVVRESRGPQSFLANSKFSVGRGVHAVRELHVYSDGSLIGGRNAERRIARTPTSSAMRDLPPGQICVLVEPAIVNKVVAADQLDSRCVELAQGLGRNWQIAYAHTKREIHRESVARILTQRPNRSRGYRSPKSDETRAFCRRS